MKLATKDYKQEMDLVVGFLEQCIEINYNDGDRIMASDLFAVYSRWAKSNNEFEMSSKRFFTEIAQKLPEKSRNSKGIFYPNIKFTEYANTLLPAKNYKIEDFT